MKNKPSVSFILPPGTAPIPSGGIRIIYEYANRLSRKGWTVFVIHPVRIEAHPKSIPVLIRIGRSLELIKNQLTKTFLPKKWFAIDHKVKMLLVPNLQEKYIPNADFIVACPSQSAHFVASYNLQKGKKIYFIQGFENWVMPVHELENTWRLPMKKIVISKWLQKTLERAQVQSVCIQNGLDFSLFNVDTPFSMRKQNTILFLSHDSEIKGTKFAVEAVNILKQSVPSLDVAAFGVAAKPDYFPSFIEYHQNPSQKKIRALYNSSRIFISSSLSEGWGLPTCEAMMCGCAVIATNIPGHNEFLVDRENGVFCVPSSSDSIVEKAKWLLHNPVIAETIASRAPQSLYKFDWNSRVDLFERTLLFDS